MATTHGSSKTQKEKDTELAVTLLEVAGLTITAAGILVGASSGLLKS